jgi:hypothetical protein
MPAAFYLAKIKMTSKFLSMCSRRNDSLDEDHFRPITTSAHQGVGIIAMQRRSNWKPVIVSGGHRAENGKVGAKGAPTGGEDRLVDIRFAMGAALALGLPALIGVGIYLVVIAVLRLS